VLYEQIPCPARTRRAYALWAITLASAPHMGVLRVSNYPDQCDDTDGKDTQSLWALWAITLTSKCA